MGIMNTDIQDFGEKIGGARKDLWRRRGLKIEDLDDLELKEYAENVTKENIWPTPDYTELCKVMPKVCAYYVRLVREKLQAKLDLTGRLDYDRESAEKYIRYINNVRGLCEELRSEKEIKSVPDRIRGMYIVNGRTTERPQGLNSTFLQNIWISDYAFNNFKVECEMQGFPETFYGALKGAKILRYSGSKYKIYGKGKYLSAKEFDSIEEAINYCHNGLIDEIAEHKRTKKVSSLVHVVRPQLEHIERTGPNIRNGKDTTTDMMLDTFNFRGGEFGNWNNQDDRQACLNYAFDALVDLAYILGVSPKFISLG